ncbi:MAG: DUF456 domain-containing protein [Candidatus Phosphoribacter sp.]
MNLSDPVSLTVLTAVLMLVGLVGIVVPVVPGLLLTVGATLLWAWLHPAPEAWVVFWVAAALYVAGIVTQYLLPGRTMRRHGVSTSTLLIAVAVGIVGFFVLPVVGAIVGFVLGIFLVEFGRRHDKAAAWDATTVAIRAVLHSMGIELLAGVAIITTWIVGLIVIGTG